MHHVPRLAGAAAVAALMVIAQLATSRPAAADEGEKEVRASVLLTREILAHIDVERPSEENGWTSHLRQLRIAGKGVKFSQPLQFGERRLMLNVTGPVMPRKSLGLSFEVKF